MICCIKIIIFIYSYTDENDSVFKKPLFSDNEDENNDDETLSDDEKSTLWRKERFKRESYLSQVLKLFKIISCYLKLKLNFKISRTIIILWMLNSI